MKTRVSLTSLGLIQSMGFSLGESASDPVGAMLPRSHPQPCAVPSYARWRLAQCMDALGEAPTMCNV